MDANDRQPTLRAVLKPGDDADVRVVKKLIERVTSLLDSSGFC